MLLNSSLSNKYFNAKWLIGKGLFRTLSSILHLPSTIFTKSSILDVWQGYAVRVMLNASLIRSVLTQCPSQCLFLTALILNNNNDKEQDRWNTCLRTLLLIFASFWKSVRKLFFYNAIFVLKMQLIILHSLCHVRNELGRWAKDLSLKNGRIYFNL